MISKGKYTGIMINNVDEKGKNYIDHRMQIIISVIMQAPSAHVRSALVYRNMHQGAHW